MDEEKLTKKIYRADVDGGGGRGLGSLWRGGVLVSRNTWGWRGTRVIRK